jgi:hypothetical protein
MSVLAVAALALRISSGADSRDSTNAGPPVPFRVEATEDVSSRFPGAPRLHSFAWAQWNGKWIFIAGRTGGYHGVGGGDADFPRARANNRIWVVDPSATGGARTYSYPIASLPASLGTVKDQWMSSNVLYFQDIDVLYIAGGYGQTSDGKWITYPLLSAVHLPSLVEGVMRSLDTFSDTIAFVNSPLVQSSGGELLKLDDGAFYLAGGHVFLGSYRDFEANDEKNTDKASQTYLGEIRKLSVKRDSRGELSVSLVERYRNSEFARRDLNVAPLILPDGHSLAAAAYGGVFTKDQLSFARPIYWTASTAPQADAYEQKMSAYSCAKLSFFDPDSRTMFTTFFGGISRWTWNYETQHFDLAPLVGDKTKPVYLDGLPWIDQITTLVRTPHDTYEVVQPSSRLPAYLGTNAAFLPVPGLRRIRADAGVLDMRSLRSKRVLIGYIYGGIRAYPKEFPYRDESASYNSGNVPTKTSDMILAVYVTVPPGN